jgi:hypothetical protein
VYASKVRTDAAGSRSCCRFCVVRVVSIAGLLLLPFGRHITVPFALAGLGWAAGDGSVRTWQEMICCGSRDRDGGRPTYAVRLGRAVRPVTLDYCGGGATRRDGGSSLGNGKTYGKGRRPVDVMLMSSRARRRRGRRRRQKKRTESDGERRASTSSG